MSEYQKQVNPLLGKTNFKALFIEQPIRFFTPVRLFCLLPAPSEIRISNYLHAAFQAVRCRTGVIVVDVSLKFNYIYNK